MKRFNYKVQWLFNVRNGFVTPENQLKKELFQVIKIFGAKSLDKIVFRDSDLNIIGEYREFIMYDSGNANFQTIKAIKKELKNNSKITCVELLRK